MADTIRFPGQYYDDETKLHYNGFRYYDPGIGRYVNADPIGQFGGINVYNYVLNKPTRYIDPHGLLRAIRAREPGSQERPLTSSA